MTTETRDLVARLEALLRDEVGGDHDWYARASRGAIKVVYGHRLGDFQTLSLDDARAYADRLDAGETGAPWKMGIGVTP